MQCIVLSLVQAINKMNKSNLTEGLVSIDIGLEGWRAWKQNFTPIIIIIGLLGNSVSFMVFVFSHLRKVSISAYLSGLAVSDSGFLITVGVVWLDGFTKSPLFDTDAKCKVLVFSTFTFSFLSIWYVVAFTASIYCSVFYPLWSNKICKRKVTLLVTYALVGFATLVYLFSFWFVKTASYAGRHGCQLGDDFYVRGMSIADTALTLLIPFSLLIVMNIQIFLDMIKFYGPSKSANNCEVQGDGLPSSYGENTDFSWTQSNTSSTLTIEDSVIIDESQAGRQSTGQVSQVHKKTRKMLLVVALVFLLLNLPSHLIRVQHNIRAMFQPEYHPSLSEIFWLDVFNTIHWVNYAINFVLYSACAKSFRQVLYDVFWNCVQSINVFCYKQNCLQRARNKPRAHCVVPKMVSVPNADKVDCHLSAMQFSQLQSLESSYVFQSPPCPLLYAGNNGTNDQ